MLSNERQIRIYEELKNKKTVTAAEIAQKYGVTMETVRKDMLELERQDLIVRVHGGAMLKSSLSGLPPYIERARTNTEQKQRAAAAAAAAVSENDTVAIDSGATGVFLTEELGRRLHRLTVLTSDINIAVAAEKIPGFEVILAGGMCSKGFGIFYGDPAEQCIAGIRPDYTFIIPSAVTEDGIFVKLYNHASTVRAYLGAARRIGIVFEHAKLGGSALYRVSDLCPDYAYFTDSGADMELCRSFTEKFGVRFTFSGE